MALIAVCLTVTFVICGRANEGSGGPESRVRECEGGREGGDRQSEGEGAVLISCVSVADLLVRKQIFSLTDSINLPHLS